MKDQKTEKIDKELVKEFVEELMKEHKCYSKSHIGFIMNQEQAIHSSIVTCKRLAQETGKKFYYEAMGYIAVNF